MTTIRSDQLRVVTTDGSLPPEFALTDVGNGQRLAHHHGNDLLYCDTQGTWYVWDGTRWSVDDTQEIMRRSKATVQQIYLETQGESDENRRIEIGKHALRSENIARLQAMSRMAESELPIRVDDLDTDLYLFNVLNGTINLRTGELQSHRREDRITKQSPVTFEPQAECPRFLAFLERVCAGRHEKINYLQRFFGYALTGATTSHMFLFLYGPGRNGKSVLINVMSYIYGDYAREAPAETILQRERKELSNDIALLAGSRFVSTTETEQGARLAEPQIKHITGGDRITARHLYHDYFTFTPTFKIAISGNHRPVIRGTDPAIWERVHLVPFDVTIPAEERDPGLEQKLRSEASGILNWAMVGCLEWQRIDLQPPDEVRYATEEYREDMDILGQFLTERCAAFDSARVLQKPLFDSYREWCDEKGYKAKYAENTFVQELKGRGFEHGHEPKTRRGMWKGLGLLFEPGAGVKGGSPLPEDFSTRASHEKEREMKGYDLHPPSQRVLETGFDLTIETI